MKSLPCLLLAALSLLAPLTHAAQTNQARAFCLSPRFQRGSGETGEYSLDLTSLNSGINGELAPNAGTYDHFSYLTFNDELFGEPLYGQMVLNVPTSDDANNNGFPDFFEVSQPTAATSSGLFSVDIFGDGSVQATWQRLADSSVGSCILKLKLNNNPFATWQTFTHTYEILEYAGPLAYTPGSNAVTGIVYLKQTGTPDNLMQGPVQFLKSTTDRFNLLSLQTGTWTNALSQDFTFATQRFDRDLQRLTNYFGYLLFNDGDPNSPDPDYDVWVLSIDDTNDFNHNGIPDFSDDPQTTQPRQPQLSLSLGRTNLLLTIKGEVGHFHQVQESPSLPTSNWQTVLSVTLTNNPQTLSLPLPVTTTRFWRVQVQ